VKDDNSGLFTRLEWIDWIQEMYREHEGMDYNQRDAIIRADEIMRVIKQIPRRIRRELERHRNSWEADEDEVAAKIRRGQLEYWRRTTDGFTKLQVDSVGIPHDTEVRASHLSNQLKVAWWTGKGQRVWHDDEQEENKRREDDRIAGPEEVAFPAATKWRLGEWTGTMGELTIKEITKYNTRKKFQRPNGPKNWRRKMPIIRRRRTEVRFHKVWKLKSYFTTPRDEVTWKKALHRTLYMQREETCLACKGHRESILHLVECPHTRREFWNKICEFISKFEETGDNTTL